MNYFCHILGQKPEWKNLDSFLKASIECNPSSQGGIISKDEFYLQFNNVNVEYSKKIEEIKDELIGKVQDLTSPNGFLSSCNAIINALTTEHPIVFPLLIVSKANTYASTDIKNPNLLLEFIRKSLVKDEIETLLQNSCQNVTCTDALSDVKSNEFTAKSFKEQASTFDFLIRVLTVDLEPTYVAIEQQTPQCEAQIKEKCRGKTFKKFLTILSSI